jgi:hypothetical protein
MKKQTQIRTKAGQDYAVAYAAHYATKNLKEAFELYRGVMAAYPESQEAMYSQTQIENIVATLVPKQELFDAQVNMALARF